MKQIAIIISVAITISLLTTLTYHSTQKSDINYFQGHRLFLMGKHEEAIPFYIRSLEEGKISVRACKELAYCYLWTGRSKQAIRLFENVSEKEPDDIALKIALADAYAWNAQYDLSIAALKEAILKSDSLEAKIKSAEVYIWSGSPAQALRVLEPLAKEYPDNEDIKLLLGKALYYSGHSKEASKILEGILYENTD